MDDIGMAKLPWVERFPCSVKDFLFTHGEVIKTWRQMEQVGLPSKQWFPFCFWHWDSQTFRQLINYCFDKGNQKKIIVSCCLRKFTTGTVNGKSNLHLHPARMNCGKYLIKKDNVTQICSTEQLKIKCPTAPCLNSRNICACATLMKN